MMELPSIIESAEITNDWGEPLERMVLLIESEDIGPLPDWLAVEVIWMMVHLQWGTFASAQTISHKKIDEKSLAVIEKLLSFQQIKDFDQHFPLLEQQYLHDQGIGNDVNSLSQFLAHPKSVDVSPHPLFDITRYKNVEKLKDGSIHPLVHFFRHSSGYDEKSPMPNAYFDCDWYRQNCMQDQLHKNPLLHYLEHSHEIGTQHSQHFYNDYVRQTQKLSPDVAPLSYYLAQLRGLGDFRSNGFSPCPYFDRTYYLKSYPDIASATGKGLDPFGHFYNSGINEARLGHPWLRHDMFVPGLMPSFQSKRRTAVIILGMHRSGTSAITRAINLLGFDLPSQLMVASNTNEAGYWESEELAKKYHDPMLAAFNSAWDDILPIAEKFYGSEDWHRFRAALSHYVVKEFHGSDGFVLKDPRMCKLARLWLEALADLNVELKVIIPFRNPLAAAGSLASRNGFSLEKSLLLWAGHVLAAEQETRGAPRCFISYDQLLGRPEQVIRQAAEQCRIEWPNHSDSILSDAAASINPKLCHQRISLIEQGHNDAPDWMVKIYQALEGLTTNAYDTECIRKLDESGEFVKQMNRFIAAVLAEKNDTHHNEMSSYRQKNDLIMQHALEIQKLVG